MSGSANVFMVEDDRNFGTVMKAYLEINGYNVVWVKDGEYALKGFMEQEFDICILDVMLPNVDGFTIAERIREVNSDVPLIFLTAKTMKEDILKGFNLGADDYITKPFDSEILICKIKAILNRNVKEEKEEIVESDEFKLGPLLFNSQFRTIQTPTQKHTLSPKEAGLLKMLCLERNKILPREKALTQIWGDSNYFTTRSMDVYITKLRKYLKEAPGLEIINIHGSGYQLRDNS